MSKQNFAIAQKHRSITRTYTVVCNTRPVSVRLAMSTLLIVIHVLVEINIP